MKAEQKSKELVEKFKVACDYEGNYAAKQCALIAVNEIVLGIENCLERDGIAIELTTTIKYWQEVKQEINKL